MTTFMRAQLTARQDWYAVECDGTTFIPADVVAKR